MDAGGSHAKRPAPPSRGLLLDSDPPRVLVPRPKLHREIVSSVCSPRSKGGAKATALCGTGGFGKTTLARMASIDKQITDRFPIICGVTVGHVSDSGLIEKVNEAIRALGKTPPSTIDATHAGKALGKLMGNERVLLVLDDVWSPLQLAPFLLGAPECMRLVTTRNFRAVQDDAAVVTVTRMEPEEARDLLLAGIDQQPTEASASVLRMIGGWAILLALVNGTLRSLVHGSENSTEDALANVEMQLREHGAKAFDKHAPKVREHSVDATMQVSLEHLEATGREEDVMRYKELSVFGPGEPIPVDFLIDYWRQTGGLGEAEAHRLCLDLAEQSLISSYRIGPRGRSHIAIHEVVHDYLIRSVEQAQLDKWHEIRTEVAWDRIQAEAEEEEGASDGT